MLQNLSTMGGVMGIFALRKIPPTAEQILAEKVRLDKLQKQQLWRIPFVVLGFVAAGCLAQFCYSSGFFGESHSTPVIFAIWVFFLFSIVFAILAVVMVASAPSMTSLQIKLLDGIDQDGFQHRCLNVVEACRQDALCEYYRLTVAQTGRALTIAEADMIEKKVAGAQAQQAEEEKQRQQKVACAILKSNEPLNCSEGAF